MYNNKKISLVIPCHNEEKGIQELLRGKPFFVDEVIVVDNGSTDNTKDVSEKCGATVVYEKKEVMDRLINPAYQEQTVILLSHWTEIIVTLYLS